MKPKLCCLISPEWVCDTCKFQTCNVCWSIDYPDKAANTYTTYPGKTFCNECYPKNMVFKTSTYIIGSMQEIYLRSVQATATE
jgi:hypothetical protein